MERKSKCCLANTILATDIVDEDNFRVPTCNLCGKMCEIVSIKIVQRYKLAEVEEVEPPKRSKK